MRVLSLALLFLLFAANKRPSDSPHGDDFNISCDVCHNSGGWKIDESKLTFDHATTAFTLDGVHSETACRKCHPSLVFKEAEPECFSCHTDLHQQTVGTDCGRCHNTLSWIVQDINAIHQQSRFPLTGPHYMAECSECHTSASLLRFEPIGIECFDCHSADYFATTKPNHSAAQPPYSTECTECHLMTNFTWAGAGINHNFFPLTAGHDIDDCSKCHTGNDYSATSPDCISCHQTDYNSAENPNHVALDFETNCLTCHTTDPGWKPANFQQHDVLFPIYSGEHGGEWNSCSECHTNPTDYSYFTCIDCHEHNQAEMNDEHDEVGGYVYESQACYACHPTGSADDSFNHSFTAFPLTGAHLSADCIECHTNGYSGTTAICGECHQTEYNESVNPNHTEAGISTDCALCHTTEPDWKPATFPIHNDFYVIAGAHVAIANDCAICHNGNYISTANTCFGCHTSDYNQTNDPPHQSAQFPTDCETCHSQNAWEPSTFNHDGQYFPIYSGEHQGEWNTCSDCHTNPSNYAIFTCITCHTQGETNSEHQGIPGYQYESNACLACHPDGGGGAFNHNTTEFPLTGAHLGVDCASCHENGYSGTTQVCSECHSQAYNQTANPNHVALALPDDCEDCHTTNSGWQPATFPIHNNYYVLAGAHIAIANDCSLCHNGNYNTTPNTCYDCHTTDYNQTNDPPHQSAQFPTDCEQCHTQSVWVPSTFDHDNQYFPIYSGEHQGEWNTCSDCHYNPGNYNLFTCLTCHPQGEMDNEHDEVPGYVYDSNACYSCHPDGGSKMGYKDHFKIR